MDDVLRAPGPVPEVPVPFVGRARDVVRLADELMSADGPDVLVLHGPAGVGKSAVAAAVARRLADRELPVHWVRFTGTETEEQVLLRLLAQHAAPRRPIVEAYTAGREAFGRELRRQCEAYLRDSVVVLDGARAPLGLQILDRLGTRRRPRARVIVTSRQRAAWLDTDARMHAVRPLGARTSAKLAERIAGPVRLPADDPFRDDAGLRALLRAAGGLPPLVRIAGVVAVRSSSRRFTDITGPDGLLGIARSLLTRDASDLLRRLAVQDPPVPFGVRTAETLLSDIPDHAGGALALALLRELQLIGRVSEDRFTTAAPVAEAVRGWLSPAERRHLALSTRRALWQAVRADVEDVMRLLDARSLPKYPVVREGRLAPDELAAGIDDFTGLLAQPVPAHESAPLATFLASLLAVRGDAHRLVALHPAHPVAARRALSTAARQLGLPRRSWQVLETEPDPVSLAYGNADTAYGAGLLASALEALDVTPAQDTGAAWHRVVRGATLCDQGRVAEAEAELLRAGELHRRDGCARGRGWALLHHARACLLAARTNRAEHLLDQATAALRTAGDVRGQNWVATERIRLHLLLRRPDQALETAQRALTAHEAAEDVRGMGWTCQYLGVAHARAGRTADAIVALRAAGRYFEDCQDNLGSAWAGHRLAVMSPGPEQSDQLLAARDAFASSGCPLGQAWSFLELGLRRPADAEPEAFLGLAQRLFGGLDDLSGVLWCGIVRGLRTEAGPGRVLLPVDPAPGISGRDQILQDLQSFQEALNDSPGPVGPRGGVWQGPTIPLGARDLVGVPMTEAPTTPRCRVRLTLLDDSPTATSTARLRLCVVPEGSHPWSASDGGPPWLTAVALPLTPASVEPPTSLLRPSGLASHGAEFDVTAHRPGIHVIRFTIALERTGTVLQQVETELEILDTDRPGRRAAPEAAAQRGW
ncbi:AAA family ATPase [Streptomyces canus]|uniref:AAA family ATPase n=1 Tax=Streptomyces canus TaxID=58343 RepID=UPI0036CA28D6